MLPMVAEEKTLIKDIRFLHASKDSDLILVQLIKISLLFLFGELSAGNCIPQPLLSLVAQ